MNISKLKQALSWCFIFQGFKKINYVTQHCLQWWVSINIKRHNGKYIRPRGHSLVHCVKHIIHETPTVPVWSLVGIWEPSQMFRLGQGNICSLIPSSDISVMEWWLWIPGVSLAVPRYQPIQGLLYTLLTKVKFVTVDFAVHTCGRDFSYICLSRLFLIHLYI